MYHRRTRERVEGTFGGGSDGLFTFTPNGLPTSTFSTALWEVEADTEADPTAVVKKIAAVIEEHRIQDSGWPSGDELCYCGHFGDHSLHLAEKIAEAL
jgi:hypothetical protein